LGPNWTKFGTGMFLLNFMGGFGGFAKKVGGFGWFQLVSAGSARSTF